MVEGFVIPKPKLPLAANQIPLEFIFKLPLIVSPVSSTQSSVEESIKVPFPATPQISAAVSKAAL